jgi:hypothetical protein
MLPSRDGALWYGMVPFKGGDERERERERENERKHDKI